MPKNVRRSLLKFRDFAYGALHHPDHRLRIKTITFRCEEQRKLFLPLLLIEHQPPSVDDVRAHRLQRTPTDRDDALLRAFPGDFHDSLGEIDVIDIQLDEFIEPHSRRIEQLQNCRISTPVFSRTINRVEEALDGWLVQERWQSFFQLRRNKRERRVRRNDLVTFRVAEK